MVADTASRAGTIIVAAIRAAFRAFRMLLIATDDGDRRRTAVLAEGGGPRANGDTNDGGDGQHRGGGDASLAAGLRGNHRSGTAKLLAASESIKALSSSSVDGSIITLLHRPSPWSMMISFCVPGSMAYACFRISGTVACTTGAFDWSPGGLMYAQATASIRDFNMMVAPCYGLAIAMVPSLGRDRVILVLIVSQTPMTEVEPVGS